MSTTNKTINDGGPAFPEHHYFDPSRGQYGMHMTASDVGCGGMTLRDWFAGRMAPVMFKQLCEVGEISKTQMRELCEDAYSYADAMLKAREVKPS